MRTKNIIIMCIAMLTIGTVQMQAQGLGGLLKKGKKALEKVNGVLGGTTGNSTQESATATMQTRGNKHRTVRWRHTEKPDTTGGGHTTCRGIRQEHVDELRYGTPGV